jgi:N-acetylglucosamine-6-sulfatase
MVGGTRSHMVATWVCLASLAAIAAVIGLSLGPVVAPRAVAEVEVAPAAQPGPDAAPADPAGGDRDQGPPDVVVVLTDDQPARTLAGMPQVQRLLVERGTTFGNAMVPTSLCCPSRASLLTGQFAHDTGVWSNSRPTGGWWRFHEDRNEERTLATALAARGYRTGLVGKYFNSFANWSPEGYTPPGWDSFTSFRTTHRSGAYYDYRLSDGTEHGSTPGDYSTDVLAQRAVQFLDSTPAGQPLFLYFAPYAPHAPYEPAERHRDTLRGDLTPYSSAAVTEDVSDKPAWVRALDPVSSWRVRHVQHGQQESLLAVDDAVGAIVDSLERSGRLDNTLIVFMSDNGMLWGEHRVLFKSVPYDSATRVPMVVRWDGLVPAGGVDDRLALNVDVTATIASMTGATMDTAGASLLGPERRDGFVLEAPPEPRLDRPAYCGWRSQRWTFVHYATGEEELYDEVADPEELTNLAGVSGYRGELARFRAKARAACDPTPPDFGWE